MDDASSDEFALDAKYTRDQFYVASNDKRGHHSKSYLSLPPGLKNEIGALIASRAIPLYRTEQDFWRDAGVHRLHDVVDLLKDTAPIIAAQLGVLARELVLESNLERHQRRYERQEGYAERAQYLLSQPLPRLDIAADIRAAILEIEDPDVKQKLSRDLESYEKRLDE